MRIERPEIKIGKASNKTRETLTGETLTDETLFEGLFNFKPPAEIFKNELHKLKKIEKKSLEVLNDHLLELTKIKEHLNLLSLKDYVRLGKYAEFLGFDKERIESIKQDFEKIGLDKMVKNPDDFKDWKTAKNLKQFERLKKRFNTQQLMEYLEKEKQDKIHSKIKEYILNSPEENLNNYLDTLSYKGEKNKDIIFTARLHKVLADKGEKENAEVLKQLIKGKKPLDFEENIKWLDEMKGKFNTEKWIKHKEKEYQNYPVVKNYSAALEKSKAKQLNEIVRHFKEIKIEVVPEIREIEKIFSEKIKEMPENKRKNIKNHIQEYKSIFGIEKSPLPKKIVLKTEENPLKEIQEGEEVGGSCNSIWGA